MPLCELTECKLHKDTEGDYPVKWEKRNKKRGYHFKKKKKKGLIFCVKCYKWVKEDED